MCNFFMIPWPSYKVTGNLKSIAVNFTVDLVCEVRIAIHLTYIENDVINTNKHWLEYGHVYPNCVAQKL